MTAEAPAVHRLDCSAGGVRVRIESDIPEVVSVAEHALGNVPGDGDGAVAISVRRSAAPAPESPEGSGEGRTAFDLRHETYVYDSSRLTYSVRAGESAWGTIDCGSGRADWHVREPLPPRTLLHAFVFDPLSLLLPRYDVMICHGTAVAIDGGASLLYGRSGAGKSTLAFLSSHEEPDVGIRHLTDDTMILTFSGETVDIQPVGSGFGLAPDLVERFGLSGLPVLQRSRGKIYLSHLPCQAHGAHPVRRIIFLEKNGDGADEANVERLGPAQCLHALVNAQTSIAGPYLRRRLTMWQRLAAQAPALRIGYREYCDVGFLRNIIIAGGEARDA